MMPSTTPDRAERRYWAVTDRDQPAWSRAGTIDEALRHLEEECVQTMFDFEIMKLHMLEKECAKQFDVVQDTLSALSDFADGDLTVFAKGEHARPAGVAKRAKDLVGRANAEVDRFCALHSERIASHRRCLDAYPEFARSRAAGVSFL
jgi:hypothetical protein